MQVLFEGEHVDWEPLRAVLTDEAVGDWMWMHASPADDGTLVHFYKHCWSRRYIRLDADGRVYAERTDDGGLELLPGCGGAILLLSLLLATAAFDVDLGTQISIPAAAIAEGTRPDDLPTLLRLADRMVLEMEDALDADGEQIERDTP